MLTTDITALLPAAGPPAEQATIAQLIALLDTLPGAGVGSPEGVVAGSPGKTYLDTAAENLWIKKTGSGTTTGWIQLIES